MLAHLNDGGYIHGNAMSIVVYREFFAFVSLREVVS